MPKVIFTSKDSAFYSTLKSAVEQYFLHHQLKKTGNWQLFIKTFILIPSALLIYASLLFLKIPVVPAILLCILFGFILASIGFNVMHDACHGSYSTHGRLNDIMGLTLNALGGNAFIWKFKHNIIHHTYTNIDGVDDDIAKSPLMRQCSSQKWVPMHRFQHVYVVLVYAISSLAWVFLLDFVKYFNKKIHNTALQKMNRKEHIVFWSSKLLYILFYIALPVLFAGWKAWAIGFTFFHISMGLSLAMVFQLAHVVEHVEFEFVATDDHKRMEDEWAIHQVKTTANFAPHNKIISWFVGGLNFQVEHHLFPRVSHIHYPAISKIVKQTCAEFNISYNEFPTMMAAVASHFRMMKHLGKKPEFSVAMS
ncbi:MAG TPA: acyl-CoA desaturase [Puia sp.]|nr:acyl-CoA desaturase [Puia sp.]